MKYLTPSSRVKIASGFRETGFFCTSLNLDLWLAIGETKNETFTREEEYSFWNGVIIFGTGIGSSSCTT
jgi:hypothetical protein